MALAKKRELLYALRPDIAVIPECSRSAVLDSRKDGYDACWWGENANKGLGVIATKPWSLEGGRKPTQKWVAPVRVHGPVDFFLLAVWAGSFGSTKEDRYIGQVFHAIKRHPKWFGGQPVVICGDFNSNAIWDDTRKNINHSAVVKLLGERNIVSAYHAFFSEQHGRETRPTYYFWHHKERCFHLDYIFAPREWTVEHVTVGDYQEWRPASDHMPISVDIALPS